MVEFALVFPIFLILFIGLIEFAFVFNATLGLNFATRNGSLVAAAAGNTSGADCAILNSIQQSIRAPMVLLPGDSVTISQADRNGKPVAGRQNVWNYTTTNQSCAFATKTYAVNFTQASASYPATGSQNSGGRCDILQGCSATVPLDSISVSVTYHYDYHTPLGNFLTLPGWGSGFNLTWSNVMRMEPIL